MAGQDAVTFRVAERERIDPLTWTVPRELRTKRALAALGALALPTFGAAWSEIGFWPAVVANVVLFGGLFLYVRFRQERTYRIDGHGLTIRWSGGKERSYPWEAFESFQTHSEYNTATGPMFAKTRRISGTIDDLGDGYGRWFILAPRSPWRYPVTVRTTPEVDEDVRARLDRRLEHRPGRGPNALMWSLGVALVVLVVAAALIAAFWLL